MECVRETKTNLLFFLEKLKKKKIQIKYTINKLTNKKRGNKLKLNTKEFIKIIKKQKYI